MNTADLKARRRSLSVAGLAAIVWLAGFLAMSLPVGDPLLRLGYDYLHLFTSHPPISKVLVIAMNESTDRKLELRQGEAFSRRFHARLLDRLREAGAERVCYDILFDQPSSDRQADEAFRKAIAAHGHVILGGAEQTARLDRVVRQQIVIAPTPLLRDAAEGWGLLNVVSPDSDGVVRRLNAGHDARPTLAMVAAKAEASPQMEIPPDSAWLYYQVMPGGLTTLEFSDCLDPELVPDGMLRGQTVFIGGQYSSAVQGRPDSFSTPYTRFGAPAISGVALHAMTFVNLRDSLWLTSAGQVRNAFWCLPFALLWPVLYWRGRKAWVVVTAFIALAGITTVACIYLHWNDRVLLNWPVIGLVQLPISLLGVLAIQLAGRGAQGPASRVQIFISAVSEEFKSYRDALSRGIDRPNVTVKVQEQFVPAGTETLDKLDDYIRVCDSVIHLVGDMTGAFPQEPAIAALKSRYPDLGRRLPVLRDLLESRDPRISYTQWEAYLAVYHKPKKRS